MEYASDLIKPKSTVETIADTFLKSLGADFRWGLAFPELTDEMIAKLRRYGKQEAFPADATLYTHGDRRIDMFVVLEGEIDIILRARWSKHGP
jgi:CRP-like cAMP-binding protein